MFFKKIASGKMLSLLLIGSLIFVFNIKPVAKGNTIYIRPDGGVYPPMSPIQRNGGHIYSGYGSKEAISVAASFDGRSSIYGDIIVFIGQEEGAGGRRLMYYNISSATLTDTQKYGFFPSIHRNIVAFPMSPNWIGLYDIYTGALTNVTYSWDLADFSVWSHNWPADPISIYDNIVAFYDSEGIWYFNRSQTPVVFNKIGSGGQGVYVYGNIIVYSEVGIIKYLNLTSGVLTDTRVVGIAPSMYCNKFITFHNPPTVKYYNLSSSRVVDTMAIGDWPSIHGRYIAFSTDETKVGVDLNNDGDIDDLVIRYYDILTGTVMNTTEVGECAEGYGNIISFATKEAMIGRDLNNDGDMDDIVVRFLNCALPPPMEWNKTYGVEGGDVAFSVVQTVDGGYALAGGGSGDFWLVKTDANGVMQWNQTYGGTKEDWAWSVVQTADGGYALVGIRGDLGFWLVKTDANGVMQWNQTYGGGAIDLLAFSVVQTFDGGYALTSTKLGDFWLVKTDANGVMQWNQTYGGTGTYEEAWSVVQTVDGGYALAGQAQPPLTGDFDFWLVKTDANGVMQWNQTYGDGDLREYAFSLVQTVDGGYALAGVKSRPTDEYCVWLVKTDANGVMQWNQTYGGGFGEYAFSLVQTADGGYALAGIIWGEETTDLLVVKTDRNGNMEWSQTYGGTKEDWAWSVVQTSDGGYALAGFTSSFGAGFNDFWLIKLASEAVQDVTITNITLSKTVVGQGYSLNINVTAADQGDCTETFNVTVYADTTIIETKEVTLTSGNSTTITFRWSTSGFAKGNYTIKAVADIVSGEMNTADNTFINGWVFVAMVGDVDANGKVDMIDLWLVAKAFGSLPNHERWDPECDVNNDGKIDMLDLWLTAREFGKIDP